MASVGILKSDTTRELQLGVKKTPKVGFWGQILTSKPPKLPFFDPHFADSILTESATIGRQSVQSSGIFAKTRSRKFARGLKFLRKIFAKFCEHAKMCNRSRFFANFARGTLYFYHRLAYFPTPEKKKDFSKGKKPFPPPFLSCYCKQ